MKRNLVLVVMLLAFVVVSTGCAAGPWTATNAVWDWSASTYSEGTLVGTVVYVFVTPIGTAVGGFVDAVFLNNVAWWGRDIWNGTGTTYPHKNAPMGKNNSDDNALMTQPDW